MDHLKFPDCKIPYDPPVLSMDDFVKFVEFNLKYICDQKELWKQKREEAVYERFVLKD